MGINPFESDAESKRKVGRSKGQKAVDAMHRRKGMDQAIMRSKSPESPYETPQERQARERAEKRRSTR